jgi:hypothetical protein
LAKVIHKAENELGVLPDFAIERRKREQMELGIESAKEAVATFKEKLTEVHFLTGFVVGQHENGLYEIAELSGQRALLRTTKTHFQRKGAFQIAARFDRNVDLKLKEEAGGFDATWKLYEEVEDIQKLKNDLARAEEVLETLNNGYASYIVLFDSVRHSYDEAVEVALAKIGAVNDSERVPASVK